MVVLIYILSFLTVNEDKRFIIENSNIEFYSKALLEDIQAKNTESVGAIDMGTGEFVIKIPVSSFEFPNKLMQKHFVVFTILILNFLLIIVFKKNDNIIHKDLIIEVDSSFLDKSSVRDFLSKETLLDSSKINYNNLETKFLSNSHVKDVTIYKDLLGNLNIGIEQYQPIARIVSGKLEGNYINKEGHIFPTSQKFSKRVILLRLNDKSIDPMIIDDILRDKNF